MSHVDDGMLHAYLDGALSALDAVRVERHVADCTPCQQRLDAARALVQRAARLLDWASPPADRAAPPLADLRPYVEPRWRVPVAWAATIIIALGVGVYGGQVVLRDRPKQEEAKTAPAERENERDRRATPITIVADSPLLPVAPPTSTATPLTAQAARDTASPPAAAAPAPSPSQLADAAAKARSDSAAALAAAGRRQEGPAAAGAAAAPSPAPASVAAPFSSRDSATTTANRLAPSAESRASLSRAAESGASTATITVDSARALLGTTPLALPEFPLTGIRIRDGAVVVEHVVPPGRVIRLTQRRVVTEEQSPATDALARYVEGLRVEISGPMAADSLSALLGKARAMP